jgi:hypothetical protein
MNEWKKAIKYFILGVLVIVTFPIWVPIFIGFAIVEGPDL